MKFTKLQATGNDFILIEADRMRRDWAKLAQAMCDRRFGVGSDGLILLLKSKVADFRMRILNADGSEAEMCGNAVRCVGKIAYERGYVKEGVGAGGVAVLWELAGRDPAELAGACDRACEQLLRL